MFRGVLPQLEYLNVVCDSAVVFIGKIADKTGTLTGKMNLCVT